MTADACGMAGNYIDVAQSLGYTYVSTPSGLADAVMAAPEKLLGLFADGQLTPEYQRTLMTPEPRLPAMTQAALKLLERNKTGFFLMVEQGLTDRLRQSRCEYRLPRGRDGRVRCVS